MAESLKSKRATAKRSVTKLIQHLRGSITDQRVDYVRSRMPEFEQAVEEFFRCNMDYYAFLEDKNDDPGIAECELYRLQFNEVINNFRVEASTFFADNDPTQMYEHKSASEAGSNLSSHTSLVNGRAQAAAKRAALEEEVRQLSQTLELEQQEMMIKQSELEIRQRRRELELTQKMAAASAEENVYSESLDSASRGASVASAKNSLLVPPSNLTAPNPCVITSPSHGPCPTSTPAVQPKGKQRLSWGMSTVHPPDPVQNPYPASMDSSCNTNASNNSALFMLLNESKLQTQSLVETMSLPKTELMTFNGDPLQYYAFMRSFDNMINKETINDSAKLSRLIQYCTGKAKKLLDCCLIKDPSEGYSLALKLLKERYGNPHTISQMWIQRVLQHVRISSADDLLDYADDISTAKETLECLGYLQELNNLSSLHTVMTKLPVYLQERWLKVNLRIKRSRVPSINDVIEFIHEAAQEANDPVFGSFSRISNPSKNNKHAKSAKLVKQRSNFSISGATADTQNTAAASPNIPKCANCQEGHYLSRCPGFKAMSVRDRFQLVQSKGLCINCFRTGHYGKDCQRPFSCDIEECGKKHNRMLHRVSNRNNNGTVYNTPNAVNSTPAEVENHSTDVVIQPNPATQNLNPSAFVSPNSIAVSLPIIPVKVRVLDSDRSITTYALLDSGSNQSFCSADLIAELNAPYKCFDITLTTLEGTIKDVSKCVDLEISDVNDSMTFTATNVMSRPSLNITLNDWNNEITKWQHLSEIEFPKLNGEVQVLIGQDLPQALIPIEIASGPPGAPYATRTPLGWTLNGPMGPHGSHVISNFIDTQTHDNNLEIQVEKFWKLDNPQPRSKSIFTLDEKSVLQTWDNSVRMVNGHYSLGIPFKHDPNLLPNNYSMAKHRFNLLAKKLDKDENLKKKYTENIQKLFDKGYAEKVPSEDKNGKNPIWYIPHHGVTNPKKPEKLRIVFDCAAKFNNVCLNDIVFQGPDLTNNLVDVLLRFREESVAFMADIESMFHQVKVNEQHRDVLRFLWYDEKNPDNVQIYRMTSHLFGGVWSPSLANYALHKCVENESCDPQVRETVTNNFYVDDCLKSLPNKRDAKKLIPSLIKNLHDGGFNLTKFTTNVPSLLEDLGISSTEKSAAKLELGENISNTERALGVLWDIQNDTFQVQTTVPRKPYTKRGLLSLTSSVYDPLGIVSPFVLKAKILFQLLCRKNYKWDDPMPPEIETQWKQWLSELEVLKAYSIPRCLKPLQYKIIHQMQLHHFCDASEVGHGTVSYLRVEYDGRIHVSFVMSKAKLSPLKPLTIPRLELLAAAEAVKCDKIIRESINVTQPSQYWTDSAIVLWYLKNTNKRYQTFICNRVSVILDHSSPSQWRHVSTNDNPADHASRSLSAQEILTNDLWKYGPEFLQSPISSADWPEQVWDSVDTDSLELKKDPKVYMCQNSNAVHPLDALSKQYSSFYRLKKAVAWILKVRTVLLKKSDSKGLEVEDLKVAERCILKHVQRSLIHDNIRSLNPVVDENELLVIGGRLSLAPILMEMKHQVILPFDHSVTRLIIQDSHDRIGHCGVERTLAHTRSKYWIINGRKAVKGYVFRCITCRRLRAKPQVQMMAPLPEDRVTPGDPPFCNTGIDFFGPFFVKRGRSELKRYGCMFTCLVTRAVHLEVTHSLTTDSFINALQRFISRRGEPKLLRSDQGSNFKGAQIELKRAISEWNTSKIDDYLKQQGIKWIFNPPYSSHFGGVWERQIRSFRNVFNGLFKNQSLDDESLVTAFTVVEGILNARPVTKLSDDPGDMSPLTPNHLLLLRAGPQAPPGLFVKQDIYRSRWRQIQYLADAFWKRWLNEYLPNLQVRQKWFTPTRNIMKGDLVLVKDEGGARMQWPLGLVMDTYPSDKDGLVRSAEVKTQGGVYHRPIDKLCLLEGYNNA